MAGQKQLANHPRTGRLIASGILTDQQRIFVAAFASGLNGTKSAEHAGYQNPRTEAHRLRDLAHIRQAILEEQSRHIALDGAQLAWETMQRLMTNEDVLDQVQFQAARWTLEAAGQGLAARAQRAGLATPGGKSLTEMTSGELERYIAEGREALAQSQAVEVTTEIMSQLPVEAPIEPPQG